MISKKNFVQGNFKRRIDKIEEHPLFIFLQKNKNNAYTIKEITKLLKINPNSIRGALKKLKKRKLVLHKSPYVMVK